MSERDRILETLSDAELLIWHGQGGMGDLPRRQQNRLRDLIAEVAGYNPDAKPFVDPGKWQRERAERVEAKAGEVGRLVDAA